ncbi:MAG: hypothetical protein RIQ60_555 [Pseudomonadota bacterium]|jgi:hypothetical protein
MPLSAPILYPLQRGPEWLRLACAVVLLLALGACASTQVSTQGRTLAHSLCGPAAAGTTVVLWGTHWRADQKEPAARTAAAQRGISDFLARQPDCLSSAPVVALGAVDERPANASLWSAAIVATASAALRPERLVAITVHELGPRLQIGLPMGVEGGTEVVIDLRVLDANTADPLADLHTRWRHGGPFVIKGVATLSQDMQSALAEAFGRASATAH